MAYSPLKALPDYTPALGLGHSGHQDQQEYFYGLYDAVAPLNRITETAANLQLLVTDRTAYGSTVTEGHEGLVVVTGAHKVTLPTAVDNEPVKFVIYNAHSAAIEIETLAASNQTIAGKNCDDGETTGWYLSPGCSVVLVSDGANWIIVGKAGTGAQATGAALTLYPYDEDSFTQITAAHAVTISTVGLRAGSKFNIFNDHSAGVTIAGSSGNINGAANYSLTNDDGIVLMFDGTNFFIVGHFDAA